MERISSIYRRNNRVNMEQIKDNRNYDVHETGHIELSGMTWEEYVEWALEQENNVQPYNPRKEV